MEESWVGHLPRPRSLAAHIIQRHTSPTPDIIFLRHNVRRTDSPSADCRKLTTEWYVNQAVLAIVRPLVQAFLARCLIITVPSHMANSQQRGRNRHAFLGGSLGLISLPWNMWGTSSDVSCNGHHRHIWHDKKQFSWSLMVSLTVCLAILQPV